MKKKAFVLIAISLLVFTSFMSSEVIDLRRLYSRPISEWPKPHIDEGVTWDEFQSLPHKDSAYAALLERPLVQLGKLLFFDPILSGSNQISCSSCHHPDMSWGDHIPVSVGNNHLTGPRNSISLLNVRFRKELFWDGRVRSLEEQALHPIEEPHEMAMDLTKLTRKLKDIPAYHERFIQVFGDEDYALPEITRALGAFQRTLISNRSRFDEFMDGRYEALSNQEIHGLHLFRTKARCMNCHHGQFLSDERFRNNGVSAFNVVDDLGRFDATGDSSDIGKFRTASLRDVMHTFPWMHHGQFDDMKSLLGAYNIGMRIPKTTTSYFHPLAQNSIDSLLKPLNLNTEEIQAIEAFMHAITGPKLRMERPKVLPR